MFPEYVMVYVAGFDVETKPIDDAAHESKLRLVESSAVFDRALRQSYYEGAQRFSAVERDRI